MNDVIPVRAMDGLPPRTSTWGAWETVLATGWLADPDPGVERAARAVLDYCDAGGRCAHPSLREVADEMGLTGEYARRPNEVRAYIGECMGVLERRGFLVRVRRPGQTYALALLPPPWGWDDPG